MKKYLLIILTVLVLVACGDSGSDVSAPVEDSSKPDHQTGPATEGVPAEEAAAPGAEPPARRLTLEELQIDLGIPSLAKPWTGDLDGLVERRVIRVLTVYGIGRYFLDGGQEKGITFEMFRRFEEFLNKRLGTKTVRLHLVFIPVARDELISGLLDGRGDIAAAGLTITPERSELIDFTAPTTRALSEILVTGPSAPPISSIEDLSGQKMYVRASSSYRSSLDALNRRFSQEGNAGVEIESISEYLEDEDLLEMVNAGLLPWAVVDDYKAGIWVDVFHKLDAREDIVFRSGGQLAWAIRKNSPELLFELNTFLKSHRQGTLKGNILINRYVRDFDFAANALSANDYERLEGVIDIFKKYGTEYGFDFLIVAAQGYQESRLDQNARSHAGAVGIMQLLPSTAADPNVGIPDISKAESNIHAGVKYLNFIRNRYFNDPEIDRYNQTLFALAAYNAGPARLAKLRNKAAQQGYDPNLWFDNVEIIAAKEVGRETVQYVANILKYYIAYRLALQQIAERAKVRKSQGID